MTETSLSLLPAIWNYGRYLSYSAAAPCRSRHYPACACLGSDPDGKTGFWVIHPAEAANDQRDENDLVIIDVRTADEFAGGTSRARSTRRGDHPRTPQKPQPGRNLRDILPAGDEERWRSGLMNEAARGVYEIEGGIAPGGCQASCSWGVEGARTTRIPSLS